MCGIAGWFGAGFEANGIADALLAAIRHRGPDGEGAWHEPGSGSCLVHTRLAILELSACGSQPMCRYVAATVDDGSWIVFNGEIYNFRDLRSTLEDQGEVFSSESDTEVLLRLLMREGAAALDRLAGMFALAFYNVPTGQAILARDAFGIKPLYYAEHSGSLGFASEVGALRLLVPTAATSVNSIRDMLMWGSVPEPETMVEGIHQLPAGCVLQWNGESSTLRRWHSIGFGSSTGADTPAATTRAALSESISRHLVSDVPVGIFLSGGIDSTAVLALTREALGPKADLRTFSIGFDDPEYDESACTRRTAKHFGSRHTQWQMTASEGRAEIDGYLEAMDQPTIDGFNTWCVSKLARRDGIKVVLSGLGGDELFGGYSSFSNVPRFLGAYRALGVLRAPVAAVLDLAGPGSRWQRVAAFLRGSGTPLSAFHAQRGIFTEAQAADLARSLTGRDPSLVDWQLPGIPENEQDAVSFMEITRYMCNQLLRDSDVFSMAHGMELRVPFVDARLFAAVSAIPAHHRLRLGKHLLLEAVPEIPHWVRGQPKRGFRFPFQQWVEEGFGECLAIAERKTTVPLVTWYRRWALAVAVLKS